jgi:protein gp37
VSEHTGIEWTDATWNPWYGCHKVSPGCKFCYMFREQVRYGRDPNTVIRSKTKFTEPLKWKEPRMVFTCSWSDWFIEEADPWRDEAWDIIRRTPHLTYQILTKRIECASGKAPNPPLPNVWLGVSVESPKFLYRIDDLKAVPAALRFVSIEPLLDAVPTLGEYLDGIDWVIAGGESGPAARPVSPDWIRSIRDQCESKEVPFFFKQWGEYRPYQSGDPFNIMDSVTRVDGITMTRVGKKAAGALLDGREWREFPKTATTGICALPPEATSAQHSRHK